MPQVIPGTKNGITARMLMMCKAGMERLLTDWAQKKTAAASAFFSGSSFAQSAIETSSHQNRSRFSQVEASTVCSQEPTATAQFDRLWLFVFEADLLEKETTGRKHLVLGGRGWHFVPPWSLKLGEEQGHR